MKKLTVLFTVIALAMLTGSAFADETYTCTNAGMERIITIVYQDQVTKVPCEVTYQKDGATETLWSAQNQAGYCEAKVEAFLEKQRGWGWECSAADAVMNAEEPMQQEPMQEEAPAAAQEEMKGDS